MDHLTSFFVSAAPRAPRKPPTSALGLPTLLGYAHPRTSRSGVEWWRTLARRWPAFARWVESPAALRAPRAWPRVLRAAWAEGGVQAPPPVMVAAALSTGSVPWPRWRGLPELLAFVHGWPCSQAEIMEARYAVQALTHHVPWLVYQLCPDLSSLPMPGAGGGRYVRRRLDRARFEARPLSYGPLMLARVLAAEPAVIKALPRKPWVHRGHRLPVERSLMERGMRGWKKATH